MLRKSFDISSNRILVLISIEVSALGDQNMFKLIFSLVKDIFRGTPPKRQKLARTVILIFVIFVIINVLYLAISLSLWARKWGWNSLSFINSLLRQGSENFGVHHARRHIFAYCYEIEAAMMHRRPQLPLRSHGYHRGDDVLWTIALFHIGEKSIWGRKTFAIF